MSLPTETPRSNLPTSTLLAHLPSPDAHHPLKRVHVSNSSSASLEQPSSKQAKHSPPGLRQDSDQNTRDSGRERRDGPRDDIHPNLWPTSPLGNHISLLEAAATVLTRGDEMPLPMPAAGNKGPGRGSMPIRTTPTKIRHGGGQGSVDIPDMLALTEYLQLDERPTMIVDVADEANLLSSGLHLHFANQALNLRPAILNRVQGLSEDPIQLFDLEAPFSEFKAWILVRLDSTPVRLTFPFAGLVWQSSLVRGRFRVVHAQIQPSSPFLIGEDHNQRSTQQYAGLSSVPPSTMATSGYFDMPPRSSGEILRSMHTLVSESRSRETSPSTPGHARLPAGQDHGGSLNPPLLPSNAGGAVSDAPLSGVPARKNFFDWTRMPLSPSLPSHVRFAREVDWAQTSLGAIDQWPADLRGMCNLIMASPHPSAMYWGTDHVAIYNEAYVLLAGQKHPALMGSRYRDAWAEIWDVVEEVFENAFKHAQATMKDDDCLFIMRSGFLEETYFSWSIIPLVGDDGTVIGLYNPAFEKTRRKLAERRMLTLREIGERTATARRVSEFWGLLIDGIKYNEYDAPMVLLYSLSEDMVDSDAVSSASSGAASNKTCYLEGSLGVPPGHKSAPAVIDMKTGTKGFAPAFRQALRANGPIVLRADDGTLEADMLEGIEWRGFGDPSRIVVVSPIHPTTGESTLGFLVMATNPRRPYDEDYDLFVHLLGRQLATSIASVVLFEEEIEKGQKAAQLAAQDRIELSNQLVARTQQAVDAENKFTRMAELSPVGIFIGDRDGQINFVNDAWYRLSSYPRDVRVENEWINYVIEEDQSKVRQMWNEMLDKRCPISTEFRFRTPWRDSLGNEGNVWVLMSASPEQDDDGAIVGIFGSMTNISAQKFAENLQTRRMEEAVELKRQQERYIDTTSHEMRNPLSAILQCADSITFSLDELRDTEQLTGPQREMLDLTIDSAQTITLCALHQKRIVDDVLTLSKLDSAMMAVSPVDTQPITVVHKVLKMFDAELQRADIRLEVKIDPSLNDLQVDWVRLDPHRLSQVLINLMTNATKFTSTQDNRVITMHMGASVDKPSQEDKWKLTYIPSRSSKEKDVTAAAEWGLGSVVYLHFAVQDTGRGLDESEKRQLFQRFSQASPRTHVTYGGSGLGLFISRELVELQGGQIGVASESGKGSIFAFYVKARRSRRPSGEGDASLRILNNRGSRASLNRTRFSSNIALPPQATPSTIGASSTLSANATLSDILHVLIVEDNLINQKVLASQLRRTGCVVHVANHGGEAIEHILRSKFNRGRAQDGIDIDVVLMDLEMPVMDGQTCARKLREMQISGELSAHVPVIAVTANARAEQIEMTLKSGIDDVVSKPFRIPELIPKMKDVIGRFNPAKSQP